MAPLLGLASVSFLAHLPGGQQCANTFHISNPGLGTAPQPADLQQLATDLDAWFRTTYEGILTTGSTYDAVKTAQVPDPTIPHDAYADYILPTNLPGTRTASGNAAPNQACACVALKTNSGQRSYRGHLLLPSALTAGDMQGENWASTLGYFTACQAFVAKLQAGCSGTHSWTGAKLASYNLVIYSKTLQRKALPSVTGVITCVLRPEVHWLRSRARG